MCTWDIIRIYVSTYFDSLDLDYVALVPLYVIAWYRRRWIGISWITHNLFGAPFVGDVFFPDRPSSPRNLGWPDQILAASYSPPVCKRLRLMWKTLWQESMVQDIIDRLGLSRAADTLVGDIRTPGVLPYFGLSLMPLLWHGMVRCVTLRWVSWYVWLDERLLLWKDI